MNATIKRLSLCPCGHPMLRPDLPLGTIFEIDEASTKDIRIFCGGCGRIQTHHCVYVAATVTGHAGFIPEALFKDQ